MSLALALLLLIPLMASTGCSFAKRASHSAQKYWIEETGITPSKKTYPKVTMKSNHPEDYILPDGAGVAIPSPVSHDLYISPFAPEAGYVQSKKEPGSEVLCPYTGRLLILGEREIVAEKDL